MGVLYSKLAPAERGDCVVRFYSEGQLPQQRDASLEFLP